MRPINLPGSDLHLGSAGTAAAMNIAGLVDHLLRTIEGDGEQVNAVVVVNTGPGGVAAAHAAQDGRSRSARSDTTPPQQADARDDSVDR